MAHPDITGARIALLLSKQFDGTLSDAERRDLSDLIRDSTDARRHYVEGLGMIVQLREYARHKSAIRVLHTELPATPVSTHGPRRVRVSRRPRKGKDGERRQD